MKLPRYPTYKESGVSWLGSIPSHWQIRQARRLFEQRRDPSLPGDEQLSATQKYGVVPQRQFMEQEDQKVVLALGGLENFKRVQPNDFVISLRSFQGGIERSRFAGCVSPAYTVLRPSKVLVAGYWERLLKCSMYISALQTTTDGIRDGKNISYAQFGSLSVPLVPIEEQESIAAFLDSETAKIDALIAEQKRLLELLAEKRQAVISHAVTKGLNPDASMKPSGMAWLGELPSHWSVLRIKHCIASIEQGWSPQCDGIPVESEAEWGVLKVGCVNGGVFRPEENKRLPDELDPLPDLALTEGDVLVSRANTRELVGGAAVVERSYERLLLCDKLYRIRTNPKELLPSYLARWLGSDPARSRIQLDASGASSSMLNIGQAVILEMSLPVPPVEEQHQIVEKLRSATAAMDRTQELAERSIALLHERRSALIAAAVTGQIDVREAA
jgi:type I restriction enzyme S subunit